MDTQRSQTAWIIAGTVVLCSLILAFALMSFGRSLEKAALNIQRTEVPSRIRLDGDFELKCGGTGQTLRIETTEKQAKN
jgi:hypothetical protein